MDIAPGLGDELSRFVPRFDYLLDDLAAESDSALQARAMSALGRLALFCLKRARHSADLAGELRRWTDAMRAVLDADTGADALIGVLSYIMQVADVPAQELRQLLADNVGADAEEAVMSTADQLRAEGRVEGRAEGRAELLLRLLTARFDTLTEATVERVRKAADPDLDRWAERVLDAQSLDEVFGTAD